MYAEKHGCGLLLCTYNHSAIKVIKENCFQTHAASFVHLPYLVEKKGEKVSKRSASYYSIETR